MTALVLALLVQEEVTPFEARLRIERRGRGEDRAVVGSARLRVVPGRALEWVEGRSRLVIRAGGPSDRFHPAELWLHDGAELRRRFRVAVEEDPSELPAAVTGPDGAPREAVRAGFRGAAAGAEEARVVLRLVPLDEGLRRRIPSIRAWAEPATLRIRRAEIHSPMQVTVITPDGFREAGPMEGPAFDFDDAGVRKEER